MRLVNPQQTGSDRRTTTVQKLLKKVAKALIPWGVVLEVWPETRFSPSWRFLNVDWRCNSGFLKRIAYTTMPYKTGLRLLGVARNPANGFPARLLGATVYGLGSLLSIIASNLNCAAQYGWADCLIGKASIAAVLILALLIVLAPPTLAILLIVRFGPTWYRWLYSNSENLWVPFRSRVCSDSGCFAKPPRANGTGGRCALLTRKSAFKYFWTSW